MPNAHSMHIYTKGTLIALSSVLNTHRIIHDLKYQKPLVKKCTAYQVPSRKKKICDSTDSI